MKPAEMIQELQAIAADSDNSPQVRILADMRAEILTLYEGLSSFMTSYQESAILGYKLGVAHGQRRELRTFIDASLRFLKEIKDFYDTDDYDFDLSDAPDIQMLIKVSDALKKVGNGDYKNLSLNQAVSIVRELDPQVDVDSILQELNNY